jgi:hypothetical protein
MVALADEVQAQLREAFGSRPVILAGGPAAGATARVAQLQMIGVERILVIASGHGTGPLPEIELLVHELPTPANPIEEFRNEERFFADPPAAVLAAIDAFDPDGEAILIAPPFFDVRALGQRAAFGARRREWVALEDKTQADELFDAAGVARPPSEVVPANAVDIDTAACRLDRGDGTVWSADARDGFNGGGIFVRWVRDESDRAEALDALLPRCNHVRIAPFVEGIPCSMHGFVTRDGVAAFRPVELLTLRSAEQPRLRYVGCATYFDPPAHDVIEMRAAVKRVGEELRVRVDFRGSFTIDGILSADGWVATECNPRFGAALGYTAKAAPELCFFLLHHAVVEGVVDVPSAALEAVVIAAADVCRWGGAWTTTDCRFDESRSVAVDSPAGSLTAGPGSMGGFVRFEADPLTTPVGPSFAPLAARAFQRADTEFGVRLGPLEPARQVR